VAPPRPLLRFKQVRQLDTALANEDEDLLARGRYFEAIPSGSLVVGDFVYVTATASIFPEVAKCNPRIRTTMPSLGVVFGAAAGGRVLVVREGEFPATGLVRGAPYFIGLDGRLTGTAPTPDPSGLAFIQAVGRALTTTRLLMFLDIRGIRRF
jgi:hypothetical protein